MCRLVIDLLIDLLAVIGVSWIRVFIYLLIQIQLFSLLIQKESVRKGLNSDEQEL